MAYSQGVNLSFEDYIKRRHEERTPDHSDNYAFSGDLRVLRTLRRAKPVELAVTAVVRLFNSVLRADLLGDAVLVTDKQFPHIRRLGLRCSEMLGVPEQQIYIRQGLGAINAATYGTQDDSVVMIFSATVDHLTEEELLFVIGHEFGHIQNKHVVYLTTLYYLASMANLIVQGLAQPAILALNHWMRRAEITADRAGLLCVNDIDVAERVMVKLALGSHELYDKLDVDEYLKQLEQGRENFGRVAEIRRSHPYLPKRTQALRLFEKSNYYRMQHGKYGGISKTDLDAEVAEIVKVF